jgi:hypothetical protein
LYLKQELQFQISAIIYLHHCFGGLWNGEKGGIQTLNIHCFLADCGMEKKKEGSLPWLVK